MTNNRTVIFWLKEEDRELFESLYRTKLNLYPNVERILTSNLEDPGVLAKIGTRFVLGRRGIWIPKTKNGNRKIYPFVKIDTNSAHRDGIILTSYSGVEVDYHL